MATLKQCDRCKFTAPVDQIQEQLSLGELEGKYDLCDDCFRFLKLVLHDGGAQYQARKVLEHLEPLSEVMKHANAQV